MAGGAFITLEGVEGSGKTTQCALLARALTEKGRQVVITHEPGATAAGEAIRSIFLDPSVRLEIEAELLLVLADRAQHVREKLKPAVDAGAIVISDRYADSTTAYQGYGRGLDLGTLSDLNRFATGGLMPGLTIVLDCPAPSGLARARGRAGAAAHPDRFESQQLEFHERVRSGFLAIARNEPSRVKVVNSERSIEVVAREIASLVEEYLHR
jgi:dTMP kinase